MFEYAIRMLNTNISNISVLLSVLLKEETKENQQPFVSNWQTGSILWVSRNIVYSHDVIPVELLSWSGWCEWKVFVPLIEI